MAVRAHVDGHAVDGDGEVGAVVEIEAAQEILVGFALAAVLRDDQARHRLQHLARAIDRPRLQLLARDDALAAGLRLADVVGAWRSSDCMAVCIGGRRAGRGWRLGGCRSLPVWVRLSSAAAAR